MMSVTKGLCICVFEVVDLPSTLKVEVYPVEIFLCLHSNMDHVVSRQFSRADTICECDVCENVVKFVIYLRHHNFDKSCFVSFTFFTKTQ